MPVRYVLVPDALITAFASDPLAVGIYVAVARLAMAVKSAVPLAARDLVSWAGNEDDATRVAVMRRMLKLEARGWLTIARATKSKHRLLPTWGRDQAGAARPWCFERVACGRPQHLRGRRVPIGLLDDYIGRLEPRPDPGRALISRYLTRPLLDLVDIGVYTIGLRAEIRPTSRLQHLDLCNEAGMRALPTTESLLSQAAAGTLTTWAADTTVVVGLSVHGYVRLGLSTPTGERLPQLVVEQLGGSLSGSAEGSLDSAKRWRDLADQGAPERAADMPNTLITWDVGMMHEQTNHDSAAEHAAGGGGELSAPGDHQRTHPPRGASASLSLGNPLEALAGSVIPAELDPAVVAGHRFLNPKQPLLAGEWRELLVIQLVHGVEQVQIWQARAARAARLRPFGVRPAYYRACAAQTASASGRRRTERAVAASTVGLLPSSAEPATRVPDPSCGALLRAMGVREPQTLTAAPLALIEAWSEAIAHPGLLARFESPVGFAVQQMRLGHQPPTLAELDRWAARAARASDRYETYRHMAAPACSADSAAAALSLEARVRAIAPPDADIAELCRLADWLEQGSSEAQALDRLTKSRGDSACQAC
jgi:hypothetical protein